MNNKTIIIIDDDITLETPSPSITKPVPRKFFKLFGKVHERRDTLSSPNQPPQPLSPIKPITFDINSPNKQLIVSSVSPPSCSSSYISPPPTPDYNNISYSSTPSPSSASSYVSPSNTYIPLSPSSSSPSPSFVSSSVASSILKAPVLPPSTTSLPAIVGMITLNNTNPQLFKESSNLVEQLYLPSAYDALPAPKRGLEMPNLAPTTKKPKIAKDKIDEEKLIEKVLSQAVGYKDKIQDYIRLAILPNPTGWAHRDLFLVKYLQLQEYMKKHGTITGFQTTEPNLSAWYYNQKKHYQQSDLSQKLLARKILLEACTGREIDKDRRGCGVNNDSWKKQYEKYEQHLKSKTRIEDMKLLRWVNSQKHSYKSGTMKPNRRPLWELVAKQ